tara:strand:+ start:555 stop:803 length:249 start_codon:yes stop_codon:yes gene_type:complete
MEKTVLSKEEIEKLSSLQQQQDNFVIQLGQIEYQKKILDQQKEEIYSKIKSFENNQIQLAKQLEEKYGRGTVNLENGEFIKA